MPKNRYKVCVDGEIELIWAHEFTIDQHTNNLTFTNQDGDGWFKTFNATIWMSVEQDM